MRVDLDGRVWATPLLILLVGVIASCGKRGPSAPAIPDPSLAGADPPVVEKIARARRQVQDAIDSAKAWGYLGMVLDAHGLADEAVVCYRQAAELTPDDPRWVYLAGFLLMASDPTSSLEPFQRAVELQPRSSLIRHRYASALVRAGHDDEARSQYETALGLEEGCRPALLGLAELSLRSEDLERARELLERAAELQFADRQVHALLARVHQRQGDEAAAQRETLLVKAYPDLAAVPDTSRARVTAEGVSGRAEIDRGRQLAAQGQYAEAEAAFRRALALQPESVRNGLNVAGAIAAQGRLDEAIEQARSVLAAAPQDPEVHSELAALLLDAGRTDEAREHVEAALGADGGHVEARFLQGLDLERRGRPADARVVFGEVLEADPVHVGAHEGLARLGLDEGRDLAMAMEHWRQAALYSRADPRAATRLAMLAARSGRFGEAVAILERTLSRRPDHVPALAALVTIQATCPVAAHRNGPDAVRLARRLVELTGGRRPPSLNLLAAAQAETGDFGGAVLVSEQALGLARAAGDQRLVRLIEQRLSLYRAGRPYHQAKRLSD
jgi:tetratricopeptide (TPR) repeat protein